MRKGGRKPTAVQVEAMRDDAICALWSTAKWKQKDIGAAFGLTDSRIAQIIGAAGLSKRLDAKGFRGNRTAIREAVLSKPATESFAQVAQRLGITRCAAIGIAFRAKKSAAAPKVAAPVAVNPAAPAALDYKTEESRKRAEARQKWLRIALEAEVA